jgi:hypothetical protein
LLSFDIDAQNNNEKINTILSARPVFLSLRDFGLIKKENWLNDGTSPSSCQFMSNAILASGSDKRFITHPPMAHTSVLAR